MFKETLERKNKMVEKLKDFEKWKELARVIVRYQNFKSVFIADKMKINWAMATKMNYAAAGINYIVEGNVGVYIKVASSLFKAIDNVLSSENIEPLTPNAKNRRIEHNRHTRTFIPADTNNPPVTNPIGKEMLGVKIDNKIRIMGSKHDCSLFCDGVTAAGGNAKIVQIYITELTTSEN